MTDYVVGFLHDGKNVALVKKRQPAWQAGKINGIGGKIENNEFPGDAMTREFKEEAGLQLFQWRHFATLRSDVHNIYCFEKKVDTKVLRRVKTMEEEEIIVRNARKLKRKEIIPNLEWLIPLAMHRRNFYNPIEVVERE